MEAVTKVVLEVEKNERLYQFVMPVGAPFGEAYDAAFEAVEKVREMANERMEMARRKEDKENKK